MKESVHMSLCPKEAAAPTGETGRSQLLLGPGPDSLGRERPGLTHTLSRPSGCRVLSSQGPQWVGVRTPLRILPPLRLSPEPP